MEAAVQLWLTGPSYQVKLGWGHSVVPGCQSPQDLTKQALKCSHVDRDCPQGSVTVGPLVPA